MFCSFIQTTTIRKFITDVFSLNLISFPTKTSRAFAKYQRIFLGLPRIEIKISRDGPKQK